MDIRGGSRSRGTRRYRRYGRRGGSSSGGSGGGGKFGPWGFSVFVALFVGMVGFFLALVFLIVAPLVVYREHVLNWDDAFPSSAAMARGTGLLGIAGGLALHLNGTRLSHSPVRVWFVRSAQQPPISSDTRLFVFPPHPITGLLDVQYVSWQLTRGSTVRATLHYESSMPDTSLRTIGLDEEQFESFRKSPRSFLASYNGADQQEEEEEEVHVADWTTRPGAPHTFLYDPFPLSVNSGSSSGSGGGGGVQEDDPLPPHHYSGRRYLATVFLEDRAERKKAFKSGSLSLSVNATYFLDPDPGTVVHYCEMTLQKRECQVDTLEWELVVLQARYDSSVAPDFSAQDRSAPKIVYSYIPHGLNLALMIVGVLAAVVVVTVLSYFASAFLLLFLKWREERDQRNKQHEDAAQAAQVVMDALGTAAGAEEGADGEKNVSVLDGHELELAVMAEGHGEQRHIELDMEQQQHSDLSEGSSTAAQQQQQDQPYDPYSLPSEQHCPASTPFPAH